MERRAPLGQSRQAQAAASRFSETEQAVAKRNRSGGRNRLCNALASLLLKVSYNIIEVGVGVGRDD
jgi:hypothetical protein